jgi:hypothetical protein
MDPSVARRIAYANHDGQHTRFGDPLVEHLRHVAAAVPPEARAVAWLHDLFELSSLGPEHLRPDGLRPVEEMALALLTRRPEIAYVDYVVGIAHATGESGRIARVVKLADLDDHLAHNRDLPGAPPYAWARRCIVERVPLRSSPALAN